MRLRELDFLRGIAIILVLFRHTNLHPLLRTMGWIGVDLFFVLSGYLVSNLLFKEYQKFGKINPIRFLIRRGFKIYPLYYFTLVFYLILKWENLNIFRLFSDLIFIQNYVSGWGYLYGASWSLAIEEHFYFGLALVFWLLSRTGFFKTNLNSSFKFEACCISLFAFCLALRVVSNFYFPELGPRNFTYTHLRIDSLLAGVLLSYWANFKLAYLTHFMKKNKTFIILIIPILLVWTPFIEPLYSKFVMTIGFSLLYIAFTLLIGLFLTNSNINYFLNRVFFKKIVDFIAQIGFCSYSIYIIHTFVNYSVIYVSNQYKIKLDSNLYFLITTSISICLGFILTNYVEKYFLKFRNRYFPSRINEKTVVNRVDSSYLK